MIFHLDIILWIIIYLYNVMVRLDLLYGCGSGYLVVIVVVVLRLVLVLWEDTPDSWIRWMWRIRAACDGKDKFPFSGLRLTLVGQVTILLGVHFCELDLSSATIDRLPVWKVLIILESSFTWQATPKTDDLWLIFVFGIFIADHTKNNKCCIELI